MLLKLLKSKIYVLDNDLRKLYRQYEEETKKEKRTKDDYTLRLIQKNKSDIFKRINNELTRVITLEDLLKEYEALKNK